MPDVQTLEHVSNRHLCPFTIFSTLIARILLVVVLTRIDRHSHVRHLSSFHSVDREEMLPVWAHD